MRLLRERDVPISDSDRVFRYSRASAVLLFAIWGAGGIRMYWWALDAHDTVTRNVAIVILLVMLLCREGLFARLRPSNWLIRATSNGLYLKFRTYGNQFLSPDDLTVAFIPYSEISVAWRVRVYRSYPANGNGSTADSQDVAELEVRCDTAALEAALAEERRREGPWIQHWYGRTQRLLRRDEKIAVRGGARVRIIFDFGVGGVQSFLDGLAAHVILGEPVMERWSFGWSRVDLESLDRTELERRMTDLARSGRSMAACTIAQRRYNYSSDEASRLVESLRRGEVPAYRPGDRLIA